MFENMIFDMDGTLVDFVDQITKSWNLSLKEHLWDQKITKTQIKNIMGLTCKEIGLYLFPNVDSFVSTKMVEMLCEEEVKYLEKNMGKTYIPNEQFLIDLTKKHQLFIVSNCKQGYIEVFLKHFHYEKYFIETLNSSNNHSKDQNIKYLVEKYNLKNVVYIGDTIKDQLAAQLANVDFIHASYGFGQVECDKKINNITELLKF